METERLILRHYKENALGEFFKYLSKSKTNVRLEPYKPVIFDDSIGGFELCGKRGKLIAVESKETHKLIGNIYLKKHEYGSYELGYVFDKCHWENGLVKESLLCVIKDLFAQGAYRIYANCTPECPEFWRFLETLGFTREAYYQKKVFFFKDVKMVPILRDTMVYSILREEWELGGVAQYLGIDI